MIKNTLLPLLISSCLLRLPLAHAGLLGYESFSHPGGGICGTLFDLKTQFAADSAQTITFTFQNVAVTCNAANQQISCNGDTQSLPTGNSSGNSLISLTCTGGTDTFNSLTVNKLKSIWPAP